MSVRRAREDEAQVLSALALASKSYWPYTKAQVKAWQENLTVSADMIRSFPTYVAEAEQLVVGFFLLAPEAQRWRLEHFWVYPSGIGRGVGKRMLRHALQFVAAAGADSLLIESDPYAEGFYLSCGAQRIGETPAPIEGEEARVLPLLVLSAQQSNLSVERTDNGAPPLPAANVKR